MLNSILTFHRYKTYLFYKYLPLSLMLLLSTYISNFLRGIKDSIFVSSLGAELIGFIKLYGVLPGSLIFFLCFTKLSNLLARDKLYYSIISFFCGFFLIYAFLLEPFQDNLQHDFSDLIAKYPQFKYQFLLLQHWTASLLYIMCEICGTVMVTLLFWQLANDLYTIDEAKKNYVLFSIIGQGGVIIAGLVQTIISGYIFSHSSWEATLQWMMVSIAFAGLGLMMLYRFIYNKVFFNSDLCHKNHKAEAKVHLSIKESLRYICSSRYLVLIMLIVFCYGMSASLIDVVWKDQLRKQYPTQHEYSLFAGRFNMVFGFISILTMMFGTYILRKFKWLVAAIFTPISVGISGIIFFILIIFKDKLEPLLHSFGYSFLMMAVIMGALQIILFKSLNHTFVEPTKEMAFIPLDPELKIKGKAAVDIIGGRFGKASSALIQQIMLQYTHQNIATLTQEFLLIFGVVILLWAASVIALNKRFLKITNVIQG